MTLSLQPIIVHVLGFSVAHLTQILYIYLTFHTCTYFIADDYTYLSLMMIIVVAFQQKSYFSFKKKVFIAYTSVVKVGVHIEFICDVLHFAMMWRLRDDCETLALEINLSHSSNI